MTATLEPTVATGAKAATGTSPADVIRRAKEAGVQIVDVRFTDLPGTWQHFSIPLKELEEDTFTDGLGFDGSSIRGFQAINESDMLLIPDPASAFVDPCLQVPTLSLTCDVVDPITREPYSRDPRYVARKAEAFLKRSFTSSTPCGAIRTRTKAITISIRKRASGTAARTAPRTSATVRAIRKAISPCRRPIGCRTCVPRSCWR